MANPEYLAILEKGVKAWNEWRRQNPTTRPDLWGAKLTGAILRGTNFDGANLIEATLTEARV